MSTNSSKFNTGDDSSRKESGRKIARALLGEPTVSPSSPSPNQSSPIHKADLLRILQKVKEDNRRAESWQLTLEGGNGNPLQAAMLGGVSAVALTRPDSKIGVHGQVRQPGGVVHRKREVDPFKRPNSELFALSACGGNEDDIPDWDANPELVFASAAGAEPNESLQSAGKLWLLFEQWPDGWILRDVNVYGENPHDPLVVLSVRSIEDGFELTYDAEDTDLLICASARVEARMMDSKGGDHV